MGFKNIKRDLSRIYFIMRKSMMYPKWGNDISGILMGDIKGRYSIGAALAIMLVWNLQWLCVLWFLRESGQGGEQRGCSWNSTSAEKESRLGAALGLNKKPEKLPMWIYPRDILGTVMAQGVPWDPQRWPPDF